MHCVHLLVTVVCVIVTVTEVFSIDNVLPASTEFTQDSISGFFQRETDLKLHKSSTDSLTLSQNETNELNCSEIIWKYGLDSDEDEHRYFKNCSETFQDELYEMLCRGEFPADSSSKLKCYFQNQKHPFLTIAPFKVEEVYKDPEIFLYHDILNDAEIERIMRLTENKMEQSKTLSKDDQTEVSPYRESMTAYLTEDEGVDKIIQRIADSTSLSMQFAEKLQVVKYETGGYFKKHLDFFTGQQLENRESNRIATFLMYLNDVPEGGYTAFPLLKLHIKPQKGAATLWYNYLDSGVGDYRMLHAGCPVLEGEKWISTKWIHDKGQEFIWPCSVDKK